MNKRRRSNWYIYVITFVVTGLLLILVSSILLKSFYDSQDKDATVNVSQNQTAIFTPDSTYDFSVLVTLSADNDKTPDKYMTITYIAKNNTFVLMPYLPNAVIDGGNTIKQICEQSGEAEVAKLLSSIYMFVFTGGLKIGFASGQPAMPSWKASIFITVQYGIVMLITTLIACRKKCASDQK